VVRGKTEIELTHSGGCIIISEIPYMVNKAEMIRKIADLIMRKSWREFHISMMNQIAMGCGL